MRHRIDAVLTRRARELCNNPTPPDRAVWQRISQYRPAFTRQLVVAPFIIDLACRKARLVVEFDGSQHHGKIDTDERRSRYRAERGWRIMRLWNSEVLANPEGAVLHILATAAVPRRHLPPTPPFEREEFARGWVAAQRLSCITARARPQSHPCPPTTRPPPPTADTLRC
ncbi:DUF559 domain-containing protein [uncultured Sphingomonas sp.]|uniref:endonuclease domain-containing protein n=1 Tax=uncultured Sphingomonas sp. TaxID=158754 RepID=UPI0025EA5BFF|nr:DUF559 domain-containing protein [uncultured Sphingomonas sp.]